MDGRFLPDMMPLLLPELHRLVTQSDDPNVRSPCIIIITDIMIGGYELSLAEESRFYKTSIVPLLPEWTELLLGVLADTAQPLNMHVSAVKACTAMIEYFSKTIKPSQPAIIGSVWQLLSSRLEEYHAQHVFGFPEETLETDDGQPLSLETLVMACFEMIQRTVINASARNILKQNLDQLVSVVIQFMLITDDQIDKWSSHPDQFVADEEEISMSTSVRIDGGLVLSDLMEHFSTATMARAVLGAAQGRIQTGIAQRDAGEEDWWRSCEAGCTAMTLTSEVIVAAIKLGKLEFDLAEFLRNTLAPLAQCVEQPFLSGRALQLAGHFAEAVPADILTQYLEFAVANLAQGQHVASQVGALRALNAFAAILRKSNPAAIGETAGPIIEGLLPMISFASVEVLGEMLTTLIQLVPINAATTGQYAGKLTSLALAIYLKAYNNELLALSVTDLFLALASVPTAGDAMLTKAIPTLCSVLAQSERTEMARMSPMTMDVIAALAKSPNPDLGQPLVASTLPVVTRAICATDDVVVIQNGVEAVRMMVSQHYDAVVAFRDGDATGLSLVVNVLAHVLSPDVPEGACAFVGKIVVSLVMRAGEALGELIPQILLAALQKLHVAEQLMVIQSLLLIFARLAIENVDSVLDFLEANSALEFVMTKWMENHTDLYGTYNNKVSTVALIKLLTSGDARLQAVVVPGDEIATKGIRTRSKSRQDGGPQRQQVPLTFRLLQLLIREHHEQTLKEKFKQEADDDSDGEEWQDLEDEDEDGSDEEGLFADADAFFNTSDMIDLGLGALYDGEEEEEQDPDVQADPVNQVQLTAHLVETLHQLSQANPAYFTELTSQLPSNDQKRLAEMNQVA
eukprot:TRINITY_DN11092_c0_g1_i4.p1 TRINITY_DN11092_c0_g1~~TRINITY_DN11092_c0_g1_i4.p1  ORF type:complete len:867 (+),score=249.42 TRINITY_DN11092_c0_g1_i4:36-2603(+)